MPSIEELANGLKRLNQEPAGAAGKALNDNFTALDTFVGSKGAANGLATLDAGGNVPAAQLGGVIGLPRLVEVVATGRQSYDTAGTDTLVSYEFALGELKNTDIVVVEVFAEAFGDAQVDVIARESQGNLPIQVASIDDMSFYSWGRALFASANSPNFNEVAAFSSGIENDNSPFNDFDNGDHGHVGANWTLEVRVTRSSDFDTYDAGVMATIYVIRGPE